MQDALDTRRRRPPIAKRAASAAVTPNLREYGEACATFSWAARQRLDGLPGGRGLNIAHEAMDRHAAGPLSGRVALRWISRAGARQEFTYRDLRGSTVLGDEHRVGILQGRRRETIGSGRKAQNSGV